jgi:hypothetical protein
MGQYHATPLTLLLICIGLARMSGCRSDQEPAMGSDGSVGSSKGGCCGSVMWLSLNSPMIWGGELKKTTDLKKENPVQNLPYWMQQRSWANPSAPGQVCCGCKRRDANGFRPLLHEAAGFQKRIYLGTPFCEPSIAVIGESYKSLNRNKTEKSLLTREYETGLHRHYNLEGYWIDEPVTKEDSH